MMDSLSCVTFVDLYIHIKLEIIIAMSVENG